jgi:hypothetical protein
MTEFPKGPFNEEQLLELGKTREGLRHYYLSVAKANFLAGIRADTREGKRRCYRVASVIYREIDAFVETSYQAQLNKD